MSRPIAGNPHGHTGHVRFLTAVEMSSPSTAGSNSSNLMSSPSITPSLMSNSSSASLTSNPGTTPADQPFGQAVGPPGGDGGRAARPVPRISPGGQGRILVSLECSTIRTIEETVDKKCKMMKTDLKVISGGDGYEDFSSSASSDLAGFYHRFHHFTHFVIIELHLWLIMGCSLFSSFGPN